MQQREEDADLVVIGGGLAGTCAAIAAARLGRTVSLVTNRPVLGGNSSSEVRVWVVGATAHGAGRFARETGIMGELFLENQYRNPEGNPVLWDRVVLDAVEAEPGIRLHLNTDVHDVAMAEPGADGRPRIASVSGWNMQTETWTEFHAPVFADCTGDGLVGAMAGATFLQGKEGRDDFGEEWAPDQPVREFLGSSLFFYTRDEGHPVRFIPPNGTIDITQTPIIRNRVVSTGANGCAYWWIEWGGEMDPVHDADRIRDELQGVVFGIWDYIKNSGEFDADTLTLEWVGSLAGRREYRRFYGDHVLTQNDVLSQHVFDDAVAYGGWSIDMHPAGGMYAEGGSALQRFSEGPYQIPFRCLYSKDVGNLLLAGRDISATHVAAASARVMATCAIEGQAIGTAAALMATNGLDNRQVAADPAALQRTLLREDGSVLGVARRDPEDLLTAGPGVVVSASSFQRTLSTGSTTERVPLSTDLATVLPIAPTHTGEGTGAVPPDLSVDVLVDADAATDLVVECWDTGRPQDYVPVRRLGSWTLPVPEGAARWVRVPVGEVWPGVAEDDVEGNAVVVVRANPAARLHLTDCSPYGELMLRRKAPDQPDERITTWVADRDRGHVPVVRSTVPSSAWSPQRVLDDYQRPFGGPHLWMSALPGAHACGLDATDVDEAAAAPAGLTEFPDGSVSRAVDEWIRLDLPEPRTVGSLRLVLNDDVDADLVTLHHHRTPWAVAPTLLRDYHVEGRRADLVASPEDPDADPDAWTVLVDIHANRHRHVIHDLAAPLTLDALRVRVTATNGAPSVGIQAISAFAAPSGRAPSPWRPTRGVA